MSERPVLVVTGIDDPTADLVIAELYERGIPVVRFDSADFPARLSCVAEVGAGHGWQGSLSTPTREADLSCVRSLYYRRPTGFTFPYVAEQDSRFAVLQARYGLGGVLASLPGCLYVNHPHRIGDAEFKPAQLAAAVEVGFEVPATLLTSDLSAARDFVTRCGRAVVKPLAVPAYYQDGVACTITVAEVSAQELDESVNDGMHLFQALVAKVADVRVTVIGGQIFATRIESGLLDWRTDYSALTYWAVDPRPAIVRGLRAFMDRFELVFAAFDFALGADGTWTFLECNPNGQWAWIEPRTGQAMTAAVADVLQKGL